MSKKNCHLNHLSPFCISYTINKAIQKTKNIKEPISPG
jgi:hypothetical protein